MHCLNKPPTTTLNEMKKWSKRISEPDGPYEIKFWKDWLEAYALDRMELVEKLPVYKMFKSLIKMKKPKMEKRMFAQFLNSYFEDLENAVRIRVEEEKKTKRK